MSKVVERKKELDLLRIISAFSVVLIHINYEFINANSNSSSVVCYFETLINIITRFSVPCFMMISGALLLSNSQNSNAIIFYKKTIKKIFFPAFAFSVFYLINNWINAIIFKENILFMNIKYIISGGWYALWYVYMLIGVYLLLPLLVKIKDIISVKQYVSSATILLIWAIFSQIVSDYHLPYALGNVVAWCSYLLWGDIIYNHSFEVKISNKIAYMLLILCVGISFCFRINGFTFFEWSPNRAFFSPTIVVMSLVIFYKFSNVRIENGQWISTVARNTYLIYLLHAGVYRILLFHIFNINDLSENTLISIFTISVLTFIISYILSMLLRYLLSFFIIKNQS